MTGCGFLKRSLVVLFLVFILGCIIQDGSVKSGSLKDSPGGSLGLFKERSFAGKQNTSLAALTWLRRQRGVFLGRNTTIFTFFYIFQEPQFWSFQICQYFITFLSGTSGNRRVDSEHGAHLDQPLSLRHDFTICRVGALRIRLGSGRLFWLCKLKFCLTSKNNYKLEKRPTF